MMGGRKWRIGGPPLALQIMGLLVGGLLVAQLVTLVLTLVLPPAPTPQYGLDDIASSLAGASDDGRSKGLQRIVQKGPPDVSGPGWLVSERSRRELAQLMGVEEDRVGLAFYTPLPFAGTAGPRTLAMANDGYAPRLAQDGAPPDILHIQYAPQPMDAARGGFAGLDRMGLGGLGVLGGPGMMPPSPFRQRGGPEGMRLQPPFPGTLGRVDRIRPLVSANGAGNGAAVRLPDYTTTASAGQSGAAVNTDMRPARAGDDLLRAAPPAEMGAIRLRGDAGAVRTQEVATGGEIPPNLLDPGGRRMMPNGRGLLSDRLPPVSVPQSGALVRTAPAMASPPLVSTPAPAVVPSRAPLVAPTPILPAPILLAPDHAPPAIDAQPAAARSTADSPPSGPPIRITPERRTLFGIAPAPFVEGDFVAALKIGDGRWAVVQPAPQPFPNAWQRRILLWFAIALTLVAPVGWLFARHLVKPIDRFAGAAERLGRDPAAEIGKLDGPAEIGRAAHAFNLMQNRLRAFVDDRTAMVGAISHDLRTPLTRMRFRIEDVEDESLRDGLLEEVDEMEAMIAQVIDFLRDASAPARRERLDLGTILEDVVEDARLVGGDVTVEQAQSAQVEVDVLGMKRLFDNLLENAVKYGLRARVRLRTDGDEAIAEIIDDGPGLPEEEMEHVFEPFYRSETARNSDKSGSGLGLAVCRSIARAHGGDIRLRRGPDGFTAELRVPLVYGREKPVPA